METWFIILVSFSISALLKSLLNLTTNNKVSENNKLPPGPYTINNILGNFIWLRKPLAELEHIIHELHVKYGPIITIYIGFRPSIFVANRSLAHKALVQIKTVPFLLTSQLLHQQMRSYLVTNTISALLITVPHGDSFVAISVRRFSTLHA